MAPGVEDEDEKDEGGGLISLDMGSFGSGSMSDPLRHAVGLRTSQDAYKMKMWNSLPQMFQNTIFHGEQDIEIKALRLSGSLRERLDKGKVLKDSGNEALRRAPVPVEPQAAMPVVAAAPVLEVEALQRRVDDLEACILEKEQELKAMRRTLATAKSELAASLAKTAAPEPPKSNMVDKALKDSLEKAISNYEKAAGLFRYVECVRPDWKNDDGSYKGIEDHHLRVDRSALDGEGPEVAEAMELVTSCYLNIALAAQKLGDFDRMRTACDEVLLQINADCVKALYRRAQARTLAPGALGEDWDAALQDLHRAAQLAPQDKDVRSLLAKLRADKRRQEANERSTFAGLFDRGQLVTAEPEAQSQRPEPKLDLNDPRVQAMLDVRPGPGGFVT